MYKNVRRNIIYSSPKPPKCPIINIVNDIHALEYYTAIRENKLFPCMTTSSNLITVLSKSNST